jgi:hypothetical protein
MFEGHYNPWRNSRIEGIKKYVKLDVLKGKTILEVGCGYADLGNIFSQFGCKVTSSDARVEHLDEVNKKYPHINTFLLDCDKDKIVDKYDIILHWGVLYHITNIKEHLQNVCEKCDILFLESEVSDTIDPDYNIVVDEKGHGYDQAFNDYGSRPSEKYVEKILEENGFNFKMIKDPILNAVGHIYDWDVNETKIHKNGLRRYWICWKPTVDILL